MRQSLVDLTRSSRDLVKYGGSQLIHHQKTLDVARLLIFMVRSSGSGFGGGNPLTTHRRWILWVPGGSNLD